MQILIEGIELSEAQQKELAEDKTRFLNEIERLCGQEILAFFDAEAERQIRGEGSEITPTTGLLS